MTRQRISIMTLIFLLAIACIPGGMVRAAGTDEIKNYAIDILPQEDGSLVDTYAINWCVISNSAGPLTWITLGMPNEQYEIMSSSGDVASVTPYDQGFNYQIRIDLPREVNAGDCVNVTVQIHQYGLAKLDETADQIGFQFTPGWFDEVPVDQLQLTWHLPSDATQVKSVDPKPTDQSASQAVWKTSLQPGGKYPISIQYDKAAFPNFNPNNTGLPAQTAASPSETGYSTAVSTTDVNTGAPVPSIPDLVQPLSTLSASSCICMCIILFLVLFVIFVVFRSISSAGRSYRGGGFFGGYTGGGGWLGGGGGGWGSGAGGCASITNRTGGGCKHYQPHRWRQWIIRRTRYELCLCFQRLCLRLCRGRQGGLQPEGI